jgi:anti-sigma B factor antagonist
MQLTLRQHLHGEVLVLEVQGHLDAFTAARLRDACTRVLRAGHHRLLLDLERVTFIDSSGLGVLVGTLRRARGLGGDVQLVCPSRHVHRIFKLTGMGKMFTIHPSREAALGGPAPASPQATPQTSPQM